MPTQQIKPLILVDGSSYLFRAYYALPPLNNSKGEPTGAVYGVLNMLRKLMKDYEPEHIAVIFDPKGKTFRSDLYPEYKANRSAMPDDLRIQIQPLHDSIRALGLPLIIVDGVEADDVIATLALQAEQQQLPVLISTGDKDLAQLVGPHITLINTMNNKLMDRDAVVEKFGVTPEQIIDFLSLTGDTVDNVPGIPKVGPKTAAKWLNEYGSLDEIVKNAESIKGKVGENLRNHLNDLPLSRELVTVKTDVDVDCHPKDLKPSEPNKNVLIELFGQLEFKAWLSEILGGVSEPKKSAKKNYTTITNKADLSTWLKKLERAEYFAFDTETTSLNSMRAELVGISFSVKSGEAAYVPLKHDYIGAPEQLDKDYVLQELQQLLGNPGKIIIGQNLKYDIEVLRNQGVEIKAQMMDTLLESYVLNSTSSRHDMNTLALKYLGVETIKFEDVAGKGKAQLTFNQIPLEQASEYAAEDADITLQLHEKLWPMIEEVPEYKKVLMDIELPLMPVLADVEYNGVLVDANMLQKQSEVLAKRIGELEQEAYKQAGCEFNLGSPKQLQKILYEDMTIPVIKKTPKGQPSTAEGVLQELAMDYPLPKVILEYRSLSKLKSTYTDKLPLQINPKTGRVHTSYNQAVTATGRLSSTDPNLQNIPVRTEEGRKIRQAFIAAAGHKVVAADYSQVELRIMAHLSQDPGLLEAFKNGWDVHRSTAAEVFGVALDKVTPEQRRSAKAINFGLMYGMSAFGLAQQLGVDRHKAQEYIDVYFERYPNVHNYMERSREFAAKHGYVETVFNRRLYIPEINVTNIQRRRAAERAAINAPLQGSAADVIKIAMINIHEWIQTCGLDIKMIMQVHDELVFEVADKDVEAAKLKIDEYMQAAGGEAMHLVVEIGMGENWDEAH